MTEQKTPKELRGALKKLAGDRTTEEIMREVKEGWTDEQLKEILEAGRRYAEEKGITREDIEEAIKEVRESSD